MLFYTAYFNGGMTVGQNSVTTTNSPSGDIDFVVSLTSHEHLQPLTDTLLSDCIRFNYMQCESHSSYGGCIFFILHITTSSCNPFFFTLSSSLFFYILNSFSRITDRGKLEKTSIQVYLGTLHEESKELSGKSTTENIKIRKSKENADVND